MPGDVPARGAVRVDQIPPGVCFSTPIDYGLEYDRPKNGQPGSTGRP